MAVTMDLLDSESPMGTIHPRDKTTVAERLLLGARAVAYKENIYWTGPILDRVELVELSKGMTIIVVVHYKNSSLLPDGIEVRQKNGFEVMIILLIMLVLLQTHLFIFLRFPSKVNDSLLISRGR